MSDELIRTVQGMAALEKAMERFMESSVAARKRLSDATWVELVNFKKQHPEVTIDDIIAIHEEFLRDYDAKTTQFTWLQGQVKGAHRGVIDAALDAQNERGKSQ